MADRVQRQGSARLIVASAFLVIALAIGYYVVIVLPAKERERVQVAAVLELEAMRMEREREEAWKRQFTGCLKAARTTYEGNWAIACQEIREGKECSLPTARAEALNQRYTQAQELCVKKYK
jgi:Tfp pilus assembly protein PilV